jgi:hypothetical protein
MKLTPQQYAVLLKPLPKHRVSSRQQGGMNLSYMEAWDVKAHLIRVFGFGGWSADVISADLMFEDQDEKGRWSVGYKVLMRLRIHANDGDLFGDTTYTEAAVGSSLQPSRGEAHDMAVKTAESDALKRAAINLGTQFGLSLYDGGNRNDVVGHTLNPPEGYAVEVEEFTPPPAEVFALLGDAVAVDNESDLKAIYDRLNEMGELDSLLWDGKDETPRSRLLDRLAQLRENTGA